MGTALKTQNCFRDVLDKIRRESKSTTELGTNFETMMKGFFTSDKHYKDRFKNVKLWSEYERRDGHDTGIDLVATEWNNELCAIQCKCYAEDSSLDMQKVSTFLASSTKYKNKILVYTGESITSHAENVLKKNDCKKIRIEDLEESSIDWCNYPRLGVKKPLKLKNYQEDAVAKTLSGFAKNDRGKLIMACGTGKTLVSMHIAEEMVGEGGVVLYLVPSISLIQQSMRSWSNNSNIPHRYMAVCSDKTVSEGGSITELESPATTDPYELKPYINKKKDAMTVIFSTYHSIDVVRKAMIGKSVDLTICDEAHRTTGMEDKSYYTMIHEDKNIRSKKRLYMTATPRVYSDVIKANSEKRVYSMDDEKYGSEFYKLSFTDAVHKYDALSDFKVKIAIVPEELISTKYQQVIAKDKVLPLSEEARMAAMWHGIQYPDDDETKVNLLQRVIIFFNRIDKSEMFAGERLAPDDTDRSFAAIVKRYNVIKHGKNTVDVHHIDGRDNAHTRRSRMNWLANSNMEPEKCRILSNARCMSEGVDVPALDGIVFADPRQSVVDVVQSVGRVMRKFKGKRYGYVILPVAIPAGISPHDAFDKNGPFKVVWQVLNGLRSHDEDFAREINQLILSKTKSEKDGKKVTPRISVSVLDQYWEDDETLNVFLADMKTKLVKRVGDMHYYDKYGAHLGKVAIIIEERIRREADSSPDKNNNLIKFHKNLQILINESITKEDSIRVIAQHIILSRVFNELFAGEFTSHNPISKILNNMAAKFGLNRELAELEDIGFYDEVKKEVKDIKEHKGAEALETRQNFIKTIYGNFFKSAAKKETEQHGIVYTPIEIIDFIINSIEYILQNEFETGFNDRSVKVMDPFAGTGTFLSRLLESGLIISNMYEKYKYDLHANEVILLAYYIATVNIETTYANLRNSGKYVPFEGINYADTLMINARYRKDPTYRREEVTIDDYFKKAHERIRNQRGSHVHVIMGNPPYSAGQGNYNDKNPNVKYPELDKRIKSTYIQKTKVTNVNSLYDSYIRSLRWASDRIGESGIIAFVTNASFVRSETAAGIRACLREEFTDIWCFDLRGNARTQGETRKQEGGNVFGIGSRAPVAITILVKNSKKKIHDIHYKDIGNYLPREQKLDIIKNAKSITDIKDWQTIHPDKHHGWVGKRDVNYNKYTAIGSKSKIGNNELTIFKKYSSGIKTHRDSWAYNSSKKLLANNMRQHIEYCNSQNLDNPIIDSKRAKWTHGLTDRLKKNKPVFNEKQIRTALYRPFFKQFLYFDKVYNDSVYRIPSFFPNKDSVNIVICIPYKFIGEFSALITNITPDLHIIHTNQCFPLYTYTNDKKQDNITNFALQEYREYYNDVKIEKMDIFYYVYGVLHHSKYKQKFVNNLTKELPRIPMAPNFWQFSKIGKKLADLHLNFEYGKKYKLGRPLIKFSIFENMRFARKKMGNGKSSDDKTKLLINGSLAFENIPKIDYQVNGRTPLEWLVDRYKITIDKESGIRNDPTNVDIVSLIERAVHIGVESDRIISSLPTEFEPKDWKPKRTGLDVHLPSENFQSSL